MKRYRLKQQPDILKNPNKKKAYNQRLFSVVAKKYDLVTIILSLGRDRTWKKKLLSNMPKLPKGTILDLACGTGDLTVALARKHPHNKIVGIDLTPEMIEGARDSCSLPNVHFLMQNMNDLGVRETSVEIVTGGYALRNAPDIDQALREIFRILKPGGKAFFLDFSKSHRRVEQKLGYAILKAWGNIWGIILHNDPEIYGYIAESLVNYPDRKTLKKKVLSHGFTDFNSYKYFFGLIEIFDFKK